MEHKIKRSELVAAAKELNDLLGLVPIINVKAKPSELKEKLIEAAGLLTEDDEMTKATMAILKTLQSNSPTDAEKKEVGETGEDVEPEVPEVPEADLHTLVKETKKLADLKTIVLEYDAFKKLRKGLDAYQGIRGPKDLKAAMLKALGDAGLVASEPKREGKSAPKTRKREGVSNKRMVYQAWKEGTTDPKALHQKIEERVKLNTIHCWLGNWRRGKDLPAGVQE